MRVCAQRKPGWASTERHLSGNQPSPHPHGEVSPQTCHPRLPPPPCAAVFDVFAHLGASDDQLDFPVLYASGREVGAFAIASVCPPKHLGWPAGFPGAVRIRARGGRSCLLVASVCPLDVPGTSWLGFPVRCASTRGWGHTEMTTGAPCQPVWSASGMVPTLRLPLLSTTSPSPCLPLCRPNRAGPAAACLPPDRRLQRHPWRHCSIRCCSTCRRRRQSTCTVRRCGCGCGCLCGAARRVLQCTCAALRLWQCGAARLACCGALADSLAGCLRRWAFNCRLDTRRVAVLTCQ